MRRLGGAFNEAALTEEIALDGVRRYENVRGFRVIMVLGGPQKAEAFFGDFEVTRPVVVGLVLVVGPLVVGPLVVVSMAVVSMTVVVFSCCAHTVCVCVSRRRNRVIPENR